MNTVTSQLPEMETEGQILHEVTQILNYICGAPTINRETLAAHIMEIATEFMATLNNHKLKISSLEKELKDVREEREKDNERASHNEVALIEIQLPNPLLADLNVSQAEQQERNPQIGEIIVSSSAEFKVEAILGSGVSGVVAKCWKMPSEEMVALKMIKYKGYINVAQQEAEALDYMKSLGSEEFNIVSHTSSFVFDGHFCMEFKLLDTSLLNFINDSMCLPLNKIRPILQQMAAALFFLEKAGVLHTDLKPDNIMLVDRCEQPLKIQVIDFGLAIGHPEKYTGKRFQALGYRAPEVLLGAPFSHGIDVWSLGCIAVQMFTGTVPFYAHDETELMQFIVSLVGQPPDELLDSGVYTGKFYERTSGQQPLGWTLKSQKESRPHTPSADCSKAVLRRMLDLVQAPVPVQTEDYQDFEWDRMYFADLLIKMLQPDPVLRFTPAEILGHPFITLSHLGLQSDTSYVKSSIKYMEAYNSHAIDEEELDQSTTSSSCSTSSYSSTSSTSYNSSSCSTSRASSTNSQLIEEGELVHWPPSSSCSTSWNSRTPSTSWNSRTSSTSSQEINMLIIDHPENSEEEPTVQEVVIGGPKGSPYERDLEDSDHSESVGSVNSSIEYMDDYNSQLIEEGELDQWPPASPRSTSWNSRTSSTSSQETNMLIIDHPENSEEEPTVQEVFIGGPKGSPYERDLEDSDHSESVGSKHMVVCNSCTFDRGEQVEQLSTGTTVSTSNHLANQHCSSDLNGGEQAFTQDVFLKEEKSPRIEIHLEDLDRPESVGRSPQQDEEETQCTTCDCTSPLKEETPSNTDTNFRLGKRNLRRRQQRKAKKQKTKSSQ